MVRGEHFLPFSGGMVKKLCVGEGKVVSLLLLYCYFIVTEDRHASYICVGSGLGNCLKRRHSRKERECLRGGRDQECTDLEALTSCPLSFRVMRQTNALLVV